MMKLRGLLLLSLMLFGVLGISQQKEVKLSWQLMFGEEPLELGKSYKLQNWEDSIRFKNIQFYITNTELHSDSGWTQDSSHSYRLMDAEVAESMYFNVNYNGSLDSIQFKLGVDSTTNVSGAFGGDLDPTKGMYWSWQSGYINVKIEGNSKAFKTRNHTFQYHLGGYSGEYNSCQTICFSVKDQGKLVFAFDLKQFFSKLETQRLTSVMSPSQQAVQLSRNLANTITLTEE